MKNKVLNLVLGLSYSVFLCFSSFANARPLEPMQDLIERPPQFVMIAFDGSLNLQFWKTSRSFAEQISKQGKNLKFTYFISGVYFLGQDFKSEYNAPKNGVGKSAIGFGGPVSDIGSRVNQVNFAYQEGHEIGSHGNGHFDAGSQKWSFEDWQSEFKQFVHFIFDVFSINKISPMNPFNQGWLLKKTDILGFRAPQLGMTSGLWPALKNFGFMYDTSKVKSSNYWPEKDTQGLWQFPLAELKIVGTGKKTLSMDYNFYVSQSGAVDNSKNKTIYKQQMIDTYLKYFQENYNGNRAPLNIGHHFSQWNGGAYWEALQEVTQKVCGLPEVRCVTYKEYMAWLNEQSPQKMAAYKAGQFERSIPVHLAKHTEVKDIGVRLNLNKAQNLITAKTLFSTLRPMVEMQEDMRSTISINGIDTDQTEITLDQIREQVELDSEVKITAHVFDTKGVEIARSTQILSHIGTEEETLDTNVFEDRALKGDLPEAHFNE